MFHTKESLKEEVLRILTTFLYLNIYCKHCWSATLLTVTLCFLSHQIFVISQAEARLPLQLEDAVRPDGEGEEVKTRAACTVQVL